MYEKCLSAIVVVALLMPLASDVRAQSAGPEETMKQYISNLQQSPNDYALREKIIRHVQTMRPSPAIPEEARRHYVMAKTIFDAAKTVEDFNEPIIEFKSSLLIAPWWAEANRDLGLALEAAQQYDEAITYIKLYMATNPSDEHTRSAQDEIYKIEAKKQLAVKGARESSKPPATEARQDPLEALLKKIDGRRYTKPLPDFGSFSVIDVKGRVLVWGFLNQGQYTPVGGYQGHTEIKSYQTTVSFDPNGQSATYIIGEDGNIITQRVKYHDGQSVNHVHLWQR